MIDLAIDVVIPALTNRSYVREYGKTRYLFHDVQVSNIGSVRNPEPIVAGRFVKDTMLVREQILTDKGLVRSDGELASAPSAFFVLHLSHHRLIYMAETAYAPSVQAFSATARSFIRRRHDEWLRELREVSVPNQPRRSMKSLRAEHPRPNILVIPLTSDDEIDGFIKRYARLTRIEFTLARPNDEFDAEKMLNAIGSSRDRIGSVQTTLSHRNKDGLDKNEAISEIKGATRTGNRQVVTEGYNNDGDKITGTNENFKLSLKANVSPDRPEREERLSKIYKDHLQSGAIALGEQARSIRNALIEVTKRFVI